MQIEVYRLLYFIPQVLILFLLFVFSYLYIRENKGRTASRIKELIIRERWITAFLVYASLLLSLAVFSRRYVRPTDDVIGEIILFHKGKISIDTLENILVFIPYTYLYAKAFSDSNIIRKCLLLSIVTSIFIELCQLVFCIGWFQIADMIHNFLGGIIGCGVWYIQRKLFCHKNSEFYKESGDKK